MNFQKHKFIYTTFDLPVFPIARLPKPRRSHRYACVCEAALSEKYSASNYPKLNFCCTSKKSILENKMKQVIQDVRVVSDNIIKIFECYESFICRKKETD